MCVLRCKGKFVAENDDGKASVYMLQGVGDLFELRELPQEDIKLGQFKFLFVGRNINETELIAAISKCV